MGPLAWTPRLACCDVGCSLVVGWAVKAGTVMTAWHIAFGTYGARLPHARVPTVDRRENARGQPFLEPEVQSEQAARSRMRGATVYFSQAQRLFVQEALAGVCERGGWQLHACAAASNHVHVLVEADDTVHGELIRRLIKRWLGQALDRKFGKPDSGTWWAKQGSNIAVRDEAYRRNAYGYIVQQRA